MAVTKSWEEAEELATSIKSGKARVKREKLRFPGAMWLLMASLLVAGGLETVYSAKIYRQHETGAPQTSPLNLNTVKSADEITPYLQFYPSSTQRDEVAGTLFSYLELHRPLANIGALAKMWAGLQPKDGGTRLRLSRLKPLWIVRSEEGFRAGLHPMDRDLLRIILGGLSRVAHLPFRLRPCDFAGGPYSDGARVDSDD